LLWGASMKSAFASSLALAMISMLAPATSGCSGAGATGQGENTDSKSEDIVPCRPGQICTPPPPPRPTPSCGACQPNNTMICTHYVDDVLTRYTAKCVYQPPPPPPPTCTGAQPEYVTWWVPGAQDVEFDQLAPGQYPNNFSNCYSGCGPTAWAMFFAQTDTKWRARASAGQAPMWTSQPDWFQTGGGPLGWPTGNYPQITIDVSHWMGTSCGQPFNDESYTEPSWMIHGYDYLANGAQSQYSPSGPTTPFTAGGFTYTYETHGTGDSILPDYENDYGTLDYARDWIINHGYAVIYGYCVGANVISNAHYGLATGYREKATAWSCQEVGGSPQWVVTNSDNTNWQFYINGGGEPDGWNNSPAYYVGTIKIDTN